MPAKPAVPIDLPFTPDLTQAGILYALRSLYTTPTFGKASMDSALRRAETRAIVDLALRRYLTSQVIPFSTPALRPFSEPLRSGVLVGGRACYVCLHTDLYTTARPASREEPLPPTFTLDDESAPAVEAPGDLLFFMTLSTRILKYPADIQRAASMGRSQPLVYLLPKRWVKPYMRTGLGALTLVSHTPQALSLTLDGIDVRGAACPAYLTLPPGGEVRSETGMHALAALLTNTLPVGPVTIKAEAFPEHETAEPKDWLNLGFYGVRLRLVGFMPRSEVWESKLGKTIPLERLYSLDALIKSVERWLTGRR